jgi:antitoxin HicB
MLRYLALFEPDGGGFCVSFRDIPDALTSGHTMEEAREMAEDALLMAVDFYFEEKRPVPAPSKMHEGEELVELPASLSAKVLLLNEMIVQKVTPADLARQLETSPQVVNRIVDHKHVTKIDTIADALEALGKHLELRLCD